MLEVERLFLVSLPAEERFEGIELILEICMRGKSTYTLVDEVFIVFGIVFKFSLRDL